jgi:HKD family nuclease
MEISVKALLYESEARNAWQAQLQTAKQFRIAMALVKKNGIDLLRDAMDSAFDCGAKGQFLVGVDLPTEPDAIEILCNLRDQYSPRFQLAYFRPAKRQDFHAKVGLFQSTAGKWSAIVGSSNLTQGGLCDNYEANVLVDDSRVAKQLLGYFEELFQGGGAKEVTKEWIERYRALWSEREKLNRLFRATRASVVNISHPPRKGKPVPGKPVPARIKGYEFAFTGAIARGTRISVVYPEVRKYRGTVVERPKGIHHVDCLVHGDVLGGRRTTLKLKAARENKVPVIQEDEYDKIVANEIRLRRGR